MYSSLGTDDALSFIVGVATRLANVVAALQFSVGLGSRRVARDVIRVLDAALIPLSESLDALMALENVLDSRRLALGSPRGH